MFYYFGLNIPMAKLTRIREWRDERKLTQNELASRVGCSAAQISRWENGKRNIQVKNLEMLAKALGLRQSDLVASEALPYGSTVSESDRKLIGATLRVTLGFLQILPGKMSVEELEDAVIKALSRQQSPDPPPRPGAPSPQARQAAQRWPRKRNP